MRILKCLTVPPAKPKLTQHRENAGTISGPSKLPPQERQADKKRSKRGPGHEKVHAIVEAFSKGPTRYLLAAPGPDGSIWTFDPSKAQRFSGFEGFDFLARAHERGVELALLPLDDEIISGSAQ